MDSIKLEIDRILAEHADTNLASEAGRSLLADLLAGLLCWQWRAVDEDPPPHNRSLLVKDELGLVSKGSLIGKMGKPTWYFLYLGGIGESTFKITHWMELPE